MINLACRINPPRVTYLLAISVIGVKYPQALCEGDISPQKDSFGCVTDSGLRKVDWDHG